jgi:hypothetical protein
MGCSRLPHAASTYGSETLSVYFEPNLSGSRWTEIRLGFMSRRKESGRTGVPEELLVVSSSVADAGKSTMNALGHDDRT